MQDFPINPADLAIFVVLALSALLAFMRGFTKEVLAVAAWVGAAFATLYLFLPLQPYLRAYIPSQLLADALTAVGIFIVTLVVISLLANMISSRVRDSGIGALDRSLGFLFGLLRGAVLVSIAWLVFVQIFPPRDRPDWIREARLMPVVGSFSETLVALLPPEARDRVLAATAEVEEKVRDIAVPPGGAEAGQNGEQGYGLSERRIMERLTDSLRDKE
ncbi:CvpA family protein [Oceanibacterium hippocampi]|uniref:Colicin V production protein n=1 Tax=Oceanibacterium hippocampi TaxID=745714 RepID=A0A1Y5SY67_9PROT|nr:CvpA family protein [Oceanibacterium hippocampi]SLN47899.1 Colicin V production protein [Oceanibacterium hippocampi]